MANRDFFDEEFDKKMSESSNNDQQQNGVSDFDSWYAHQTPTVTQKKTNKPLYIVLICIGLVLCLVLGWVLCALFGGGGSLSPKEEEKYLGAVLSSLRASGLDISDEQWSSALKEVNKQVETGTITAEAIIGVVFDTLRRDYYQDIPQEKWYAAVESAGTALLQVAGDQFSRLMSPQTYYNYMHPTSNVVSSNGKVFGVSFQIVEGIGMYVSSVTVNSNSYGKLKGGDIVVKMSNVLDNYGQPLTINANGGKTDLSEINTGEWESESLQQVLALVNSATFHVLRDGEIQLFDIEKGNLGYVNSQYQFDFIEFYFGDDCTNVSTSRIGGAAISTKEERSLGNLAKLQNTGYIRISEFSELTSGNSAYTEFQQALQLFKSRNLKHLILDLKGNPGGSVDIVCNIAGLLVTNEKLSEAQKNKVNRNNQLLITTLKTKDGQTQPTYVKSSYNQYFPQISDKYDIVVWTDHGSASASELLTGALTDYNTAIQMGVTTYGKGIAQICLPLDDYVGEITTISGAKSKEHWAIYYTIASYYSPLGNNIHGRGYTPKAEYNNLDTYEKLWESTVEYYKTSSSGGGILTQK